MNISKLIKTMNKIAELVYSLESDLNKLILTNHGEYFILKKIIIEKIEHYKLLTLEEVSSSILMMLSNLRYGLHFNKGDVFSHESYELFITIMLTEKGAELLNKNRDDITGYEVERALKSDIMNILTNIPLE